MIVPNVERVLRGDRVEYEHAIPLRTIGTRAMRGVYTPEVDDKGMVQSWLGSLLDITERKQAELRLAALNERLEAEVEGARANATASGTSPRTARRFELRRLFRQHQSGVDEDARVERRGDQEPARERAAPSGRCAAFARCA